MDKSSENSSPTTKSKLLLLLKIGVFCFATGATTSAALTLSPRLDFNHFSLNRNTAISATPKLEGLGPIASTASTEGLGAFPGKISASYLCTPRDHLAQEVSYEEPVAIAEGIFSPAFHTLRSSLDPSLIRKLKAAPWPEIHESARSARVPVLMYHDILEEKEVFFDVTVEEFEAHLVRIEEEGLTPISFDQLLEHLRTGAPLPPKPVLLTFDDGYVGHYTHVYPLLKQYQYPAVFSVFTGKLDGDIVGRSTVTWEQTKEMAADPLITIASHTITHPRDLRELNDEDLRREVVESKTRLEAELGIPIQYFTYPEGNYDERVAAAVAEAGYDAALTMSNYEEWFAGESDDLLSIGRFGQSQLENVIPEAWEGLAVPIVGQDTFDFYSPIRVIERLETEEVPLALIAGGRPATVHADSRYQLTEILARTNAKGAVDGAFFSLEYLDSNVMIGPVLSQATQTFVPGNASENPLLNGRPLALISPNEVRFIPFDSNKHNALEGVQAEMEDVTDAFVGAAWLVRDGNPQDEASFGTLFDFDAYRHRAFWGINKAGQPVLGVTKGRVDSVTLGELLHEVGFRDAIMVDSGASTSLAYEGESLVDYIPRPVPHMIAVLAEEEAQGTCPLVFEDLPSYEEDWAESF
ncbi:polysaccharide deacetylase family protein [Oscillatoria sp. CS-180]|uniref:polysaccharide deacetylase family protein n=1 Tax=Oscillatoria sp. CS-180 TaxID=3021720 RepID=UPI00232E03B7|nr:polysaccharide deacetylase family protein [Oscillatoria sp. CS-180]MDB9529173.1 polysaccharide deacetylase family protein [Oscillatoria sp. CS-180]